MSTKGIVVSIKSKLELDFSGGWKSVKVHDNHMLFK